MGRPKDNVAKLIQRKSDEIKRALNKQDAMGAIEHLMQIPKDQRSPFVDAVGVLFRDGVRKAALSKDMPLLLRAAARIESDPRLLGEKPDPAVLFPLTLAALRAKEWQRAERFLELLGPDLQKRSETLYKWLEALIQHRGNLPQDLVLPALPPLPAPPESDPRLGYDEKPKIDLPATEEESRARVFPFFLNHPRPGIIREILLVWIERQPQFGPGILETATPFLVRNALSSQREKSTPFGMLHLFADLAIRAHHGRIPEGGKVAEGVALFLRLLATQLPEPPGVASPAALEAFIVLGNAVSETPWLAKILVDRFLHTIFPAESAPRALYFVEKLLQKHPSPRLLEKGLHLWEASQAKAPGPAFLAQALQIELERPDRSYFVYLRCLPAGQRDQLIRILAECMPTSILERFLTLSLEQELWKSDSHFGQTMGNLALVLLGQIANEEERDILEGRWGRKGRRSILGALLRSTGKRGAKETAFFFKYVPKLAPHSVTLVASILKSTINFAEIEQVINWYLADKTTIIDHLVILSILCCSDCHPYFEIHLNNTLRHFAKDAIALSQAFEWANQHQQKPALIKSIAQAFLVADRGYDGPRDENYLKLLVIAQVRYGSRKTTKAAKAPKAPKPKADKPPKVPKTPKPKAEKLPKEPKPKAEKPQRPRKPKAEDPPQPQGPAMDQPPLPKLTEGGQTPTVEVPRKPLERRKTRG